MNIFKMLEMYLQENNIRCHIPENWKYRGPRDPDDKIKIHLKHMDIGDTIELSISQVELTVQGTKVFGSPGHRHRYDKPDLEEITDLSDPQAFDRIRLWIRQQETAMRHSADAQQVLSRLMNSPYEQQVNLLNGEMSVAEASGITELCGDNMPILNDTLMKDLMPTLPLTISNNPLIEVESDPYARGK